MSYRTTSPRPSGTLPCASSAGHENRTPRLVLGVAGAEAALELAVTTATAIHGSSRTMALLGSVRPRGAPCAEPARPRISHLRGQLSRPYSLGERSIEALHPAFNV